MHSKILINHLQGFKKNISKLGIPDSECTVFDSKYPLNASYALKIPVQYCSKKLSDFACTDLELLECVQWTKSVILHNLL